MPKVKMSDRGVDFKRPFESHGVEISSTSGNQAIGTCLLCSGDKFYINRSTGQWDCKHCGRSGNLIVFLRDLWDELDKEKHDYTKLCESRGIIGHNTPHSWGVVKSITDQWLIPGYNYNREANQWRISQLYRYISVKAENGWKYKLLATESPGDDKGLLSQGIYMRRSRSKAKKVAICEGVWDAMLLSEVVGSDWEVYAVPGCHIFIGSWASLLAGKDVYFLYDNDHPKQNGAIPALQGVKRAASILYSSQPCPNSLNYLKWGKEYHDPSLPDGYDISDHLRKGPGLESRRKLWQSLATRMTLIPDDWIEKKETVIKLDPASCSSWKELIGYWKKAMYWPSPGESLDYGLSVNLACIASTSTQGDPIWIRLIAPPSSGKSELCEGLSVSEKYVKALSEFNGLFSGFRTKDGEDNSLLPELKGKTIIIKDSNTIQEHPFKERLLAQLRDAYDGACRFHRGNKAGRDYNGIRFTLILGCTSASKIDKSGLGERMLDCIMIENMEEELERRIGIATIEQAFSQCKVLANGTAESQISPEMAEARKRTGGFVEYIRENASDMLACIEMPSRDKFAFIQDLSTFVSFMRARDWVGEGGTESQKELPFRLGKQLARLSTCLAAVLEKNSWDYDVMSIVRKVACDTSKGVVLEIAHEMQRSKTGVEASWLSSVLNYDSKPMTSLLRFLSRIGMIETFRVCSVSTHRRWRLTERVRRVYNNVFGEINA